MLLLNALKGQNKGRPPVWIMRQAGRYLPEYRAYRAKHSLRELFLTPRLAAEITQLPIDILGVDAAILFSDITIIALALGLQLDFKEGPVVTGEMRPCDTKLALEPVIRAIDLIKPKLKVPLIGFCGGPWTTATYITEKPTKELLDRLADKSAEYLRLQVEAGADAIQIFDSWANQLSDAEFEEFCLPYLKRLVSAVDVPVILFMRNAASRVKELVSANPAAISFDGHSNLAEVRKQVPMGVQGNLDPDLLYEPLDQIRIKTRALLESMKGDPSFIVNLGHGMKPDMSVEATRCFVDTVKEWAV